MTLQPIRRFDVDAAVLFSDILLPLEAMGMELHFEEGRGPVLPKPLNTAAAVDALQPLVPERDLAYVGESLRRGTGKSSRELEPERDLANLEKAFTHLAIKHELVERALKERPSRPGRSRR